MDDRSDGIAHTAPIGPSTTTQGPQSRRSDAVRLIAFMLSVMGLLFFARQGQTQPVMYLVFALFLIAATLWVRGLDANWIDGRADFRSRLLLALALVLPMATTFLVGILFEGFSSTIILGSLITAYILTGLGVRKLRWYVILCDPKPAGQRASLGTATPPEATLGSVERSVALWTLKYAFRWWTLVVALFGAYGALWALGRWPLLLAGALLVGTVGIIPAVVQVLSERRIVALSTIRSNKTLTPWYIGGVLGVGSALLVGVLNLDQTRYVLILVIAVTLLTWAFTVGSLADIAAVLAALALMGVTPASQDVRPAILSAQAVPNTGEAPERVMVALGDSYSSGEGASRYLDRTNRADNQCRRAATAWPVLVAQSIGVERLVFRACSGARARNVVGVGTKNEQYVGEGIQLATAVKQLRSADPNLQPSLVVLSIGGNDAGFRQIGSSCLSLGSCNEETLTKLFTDNLAGVQTALTTTYLAVAEAFPESPIAVMPYPEAFAGTEGCVVAPVETGDIKFVNDFTGKLDEIIETAATEVGVYYVAPMRTALRDSKVALCDRSGAPGLNFLDLRGVGGAARDRFDPGNWIHNSLHPNERGHSALAAAFSGWVSSQTRKDAAGKALKGLNALLPAKDNRDAEPQGDRDEAQLESLCFEPKGGECGPAADEWALARLAPGLTAPLVLMALTAGGTWALAVASSAQRFRRRARNR